MQYHYYSPNDYAYDVGAKISAGDHRVKIHRVVKKSYPGSFKKGFELTLRVSGFHGKLWLYLIIDPNDERKTAKRFDSFFRSFDIQDKDLNHYKGWEGKSGAVRVIHNQDLESDIVSARAFCIYGKEKDKLPPWRDASTAYKARELDLECCNFCHNTTETLDSYIYELSCGCACPELPKELEKHFMELLEDDWFWQWPLVRYKYAKMLLYGYCDYSGEIVRDIEEDRQRAMEILMPMAKAGFAPAECDIGWCYMCGVHFQRDYETGVTWWMRASEHGFDEGHNSLTYQYTCGDYKQLPDAKRKEFLAEIVRVNEGNKIGRRAAKDLKFFEDELNRAAYVSLWNEVP